MDEALSVGQSPTLPPFTTIWYQIDLNVSIAAV